MICDSDLNYLQKIQFVLYAVEKYDIIYLPIEGGKQMASLVQIMSAAADATGLTFNPVKNILYGTFNGYTFAVTLAAANARFCSVFFHVTREGNPLSTSEGKQIAKESNKMVEFMKPAGSASVSSFLVKPGKDEQTAVQKLVDALTYLSNAFADRGYVSTCERCRQPVDTEPCATGTGLRFLCQDCFDAVSSDLTDKAHAEADTPENVAAGVVGALGGALLGAIVVVVFGRLGYVTALSGLIAAICSLKGYELLAKKMSIKGAIIACIAMLAMIYVGHRADWAIEVAKYFEVDFFTGFRAIPMLIREEAIELGVYLKGLLMTYLFALLGAVPTVVNSIKGQKTKYTIQKLN